HLSYGIPCEFGNVKAAPRRIAAALCATCFHTPVPGVSGMVESPIKASRAVKAVLCTRFGGPDDLELADIADPAAGPGEAVVRVAAVGLNFYDTLIIAGRYQRKPPFPFSPGGEFSGTIESVGEGVTALAPGDRVIGYVAYGAARERLVLEAAKLVKLTADLELIRAAGL